MLEMIPSERVINVADIDPKYRHDILFRLFEHLAPDESLQIIADHNPQRLRRRAQLVGAASIAAFFERADMM